MVTLGAAADEWCCESVWTPTHGDRTCLCQSRMTDKNTGEPFHPPTCIKTTALKLHLMAILSKDDAGKDALLKLLQNHTSIWWTLKLFQYNDIDVDNYKL